MFLTKKNQQGLMIVFVILYLLLQANTIISFPYVHSDEPWLSGLSRTVLDQGSFKVSEPFFDLYPRAIHGLRVIFVSAQGLFIKVFGYSILTMRSLSLFISLISLIVLYKLFRQKDYKSHNAFIASAIIALSPQFVMASHVARQEPFIILGFLLSYVFATKDFTYKRLFISTLIIGLCIGVHPNSFLIGISIGLIYLYRFYIKEIKFKDLLAYVLLLSAWAFVFIAISFSLNANFLQDYLAFGQQLGVVNHSLNRFEGFFYYYYKLFHQIGGTYVLLNIKTDLLILLTTFIGAIICLLNTQNRETYKDLIYSFIMLIGTNIGLLIIGRYNQTAIIFILLWGWISFINLLKIILSKGKKKEFFSILLIACMCFQSYQLYQTLDSRNHQNYDELGHQLASALPEDAIILGNLNMEYHYPLYQFYDVRNLDYLDEHSMTIESYIIQNNISHIVLHDEMSYIYEGDDKWSILYGDLAYYEALLIYLEAHGTLIDSFEAPSYGMRISKYVDVYPWTIRLYQLH